jgi:hypothetical protein
LSVDEILKKYFGEGIDENQPYTKTNKDGFPIFSFNGKVYSKLIDLLYSVFKITGCDTEVCDDLVGKLDAILLTEI